MGRPDDLSYYRGRAEMARSLAAQASNRVVARIHDTMAREYDRLVARAEGAEQGNGGEYGES